MTARETWNIGTFENVQYVGIGRTFEAEKYLIFETPEGGFLLVAKDEFYSGTIPMEKLSK